MNLNCRITRTVCAWMAMLSLLGLGGHALAGDVAADDVAVLKKMLGSVEAWDSKGKTKFDSDFAASLESQSKKLSDPALQTKARELTAELEKAGLLRSRVMEIVAKTKDAKGTTRLANGGPQWLRDIVGDEAMRVFDRLTGVDLNDRQSPHDKTYKRNENLNDEWLGILKDLPDLTSLDIANTGMKGTGLEVVGTLKNLESLNLTLTPITDQYLEPLKSLTKLRILGLASAQCNGEGFRFFGNLKQLENANFHYTPVNDAGLAGISNVPSLTRLEIVHTHFTDAGAPALAALVNMERLQIGSLKATGAAIAQLSAMTKLRELDLHDGQANLEGVTHASKIATLRVLRVYGTIKDAGAEQIAKLKNLELLILASNSEITDAGLAHLAALSQLKKLDIKGCKVSDGAVDKLKQGIPGLEVIR